MLTLRLLGSIYPLLRDVFLEGKSLREAFRQSKRKVLVLFAVLLSIFLNIFLIPRAIDLSEAVINLRAENAALLTRVDSLKKENDDLQKLLRLAQSDSSTTTSDKASSPIKEKKLSNSNTIKKDYYIGQLEKMQFIRNNDKILTPTH